MDLKPALEDTATADAPRRPGRKAKATPDRFNEAVRTLEDRTENLTVEAVRILIGGTPGTIAKMLRERNESLACDTSTISFPESLAKALRSYAAESVSDVSEKWKHRYDAVRAICVTLETSSNEAERERERLDDEVEQLRNERHHDAGRNGCLREELDSKNQEIAALRTQLVAEQIHASRADDERAAVFERLLREEAKCVKTTEQVELLREEAAVMNVIVIRTQVHLEHEQQLNLEIKARRQKVIGQPIFSDDDSPLL